MTNIIITCDGCKKSHSVYRTNEIPTQVVSLSCNWCPECEDDADDYYEEKYNYNELENKDQLSIL
jgi:hypothetical protein